MTPLQRKAEFAKAATLRDKASGVAALEDLDSSWTHLRECFEGKRTPSKELATNVAAYVEMDPEDFWGAEVMAQVR
ncbi:MAG: hypothetical protein ACJ8AK_02940 [Gemmatimonadaceae bacterium]